MADTTGHAPATHVDPPPPPPPVEVLVDRISNLPEPLLLRILSFLPTQLAAQTSCLSHRFRRLWTAAPSVHFERSSFSATTRFVSMVDNALLRRDCSASLESFYLRSTSELPLDPVLCWMDRADDLGVRHLHLSLEADTAYHLLWTIFEIKSLESLHIKTFDLMDSYGFDPGTIACTRLKSLYLWFNIDSADLTRLISGLLVLENLELRAIDQTTIDISSLSVKTLKLECRSGKTMKLNFPKLEFMYLQCIGCTLETFQGEIPLATKVGFHLRCFQKVPVLVLESMLKTAANAVELKLSCQVSNLELASV